LYFTTASGHTPVPIRAYHRRHSGALALLLVLAGVAAPCQAAALLPPPMEAKQPARGAQATKVDRASKSSRRAKSAPTKVTVVTGAPDKLAPLANVAPAAGGQRWDIVIADRTLNAALARWAAAAGWQLLWELPVDYAVQAQTTVPGKFEDAVTIVVNSMEGAEIPMKAVFYSGNKVLRIMSKGAQ
jgi:hypothetical protein